MKKFLGITTVFVLALLAFGLISNRTEAVKPVFGEGSRDELETAKRISLSILRDGAARRGIANTDDFVVQKVEIDKLKMAHTRVRQTVGNIPVWEGRALTRITARQRLSIIFKAFTVATVLTAITVPEQPPRARTAESVLFLQEFISETDTTTPSGIKTKCLTATATAHSLRRS